MTFKELKYKIKEEQKKIAIQIRRLKVLRKPKNRKGLSESDTSLCFEINEEKIFNSLPYLSNLFRHRHIIYCNMFFNTPLEVIEKKVRPDNYLNPDLLFSIEKKWRAQLDE